MALTGAERFLVGFHARHAGATSEAFGALPVRCEGREYASSYALLAAHVGQAAGALLDLACGDGFLLSMLAQRNPPIELAGVDISADELTAAAGRLNGRAVLEEARAQALPFADASFDAVTCHMALMLMDEPQRVLAEIRRVLRKGGALVAVISSVIPASPAMDAYRALLKPRLSLAEGVIRLGDPRWRDPGALEVLLRDAGFEEVTQAIVESEVRLSPAALWAWFMRMYDLHFLDHVARVDLRDRFMSEATALADADGKLLLPLAWRLVSVRTSPTVIACAA